MLIDIVQTIAQQNFCFSGDGNAEKYFRQVTLIISQYCPILVEWTKDPSMRP